MNLLPFDIELLYPAQFGANLVLTPHTYLLNDTTVLTDSIYLNGQDNPDAVFVIQINGALTTSTYAKILLINGAQAKNVYWKIDGAVLISDYSEFKGTIICNNGAIDLLTGVQLIGRALTTTGALSTAAITVTMTPGCVLQTNDYAIPQKIAVLYPNPFEDRLHITLSDPAYLHQAQVLIYDVSGRELYRTPLTTADVELDLAKLAAGTYYYKINDANKTLQFGALIAK